MGGGRRVVVTDATLSELIAGLRPSERRIVERHLAGEVTEVSREIMRMLRRKLKRKIRTRVRRFVWLA
jgi:hypothetical protein